MITPATSGDSSLLVPLGSTPAITNLDFANAGNEYFGWHDPDADLTDFFNLEAIPETAQCSSLLSPTFIPHSAPTIGQRVQGQQIAPPLVSIPMQLTYAARSLIRRTNMELGTQRTASLILHTLKSYPLMMLRNNTMPPFIHPRLISSDVENNDMEPLNNCISLVHMLGSRVPGSRKLFWKNVRMECERWYEKVRWQAVLVLGSRLSDEAKFFFSFFTLASRVKQMGTRCCHASSLYLHHRKVG
jgi:hypothetical protein